MKIDSPSKQPFWIEDPVRFTICLYYIVNTTVPIAWCAAISERSAPIKLAIALLDVSSLVATAVTSRSIRPEIESNTLIINDPSGLTVQVQESG
jgi:hypothetical protein